jgi:hypothetical protein
MSKENNIQSRQWYFRLVGSSEFTIVAFIEIEIILTVQRIIDNRRWGDVITIRRNNNNNYNYELVGIIEFDFPWSLN